jgi:3-hydroxybutyrate dehydrogenase
MASLDGKVALITGAASGLGKAIAELYAKNGAAVAIADINQQAADAAAAEIKAAGGKAIGIAMDVTNEEAVNAGTDKAVEAFGGLDVLISNAGVQIINPIDQFSFADWKKMLAIHLDGGFLTTKAALKYMYKDNRGGTVIYMGSVHSHEASRLKSAYVTAKHGLLGLARTLAKEGAARNVRSHVICPGFVRTPLVEKQIPDQAKAHKLSESDALEQVILAPHAIKELIEPSEVAETVAFLAGPAGRAFTGAPVTMDMGWTAR